MSPGPPGRTVLSNLIRARTTVGSVFHRARYEQAVLDALIFLVEGELLRTDKEIRERRREERREQFLREDREKRCSTDPA